MTDYARRRDVAKAANAPATAENVVAVQIPIGSRLTRAQLYAARAKTDAENKAALEARMNHHRVEAAPVVETAKAPVTKKGGRKRLG